MAQQLYFSRDSKLFVELEGKLWEVPVLDGFSFSQTTNASEITLNEMQNTSGISRRGRRVFTDSLAPAEWSFSTYVRPFVSSNGEHHAVEEVLWAVMAGADSYGTISGQGTIVTISESDTATDRTDGFYTIDQVDYTTDTAAGTGATFQVVVTSGAVTSVSVVNGGTGYSALETFTIPSSVIGGTGNLVITVDTVDSASDNAFFRQAFPDASSPYGANVSLPTESSNNINFGQSNRSVLGTCNLYFVMETSSENPMVYKLSGAAINEASIDFEVDGIATINWSGFAAQISDMLNPIGSNNQVLVISEAGSNPPTLSEIASAADNAGTPAVGDVVYNRAEDGKLYLVTETGSTTVVGAITEGTDDTGNFIRNRLTQLSIENNSTTNGLKPSYSMTLTGGNITFSNNITYLVPEELGAVNVPIEHVTGARSVSGSFTCYLTVDTDTNNGTSSDFFNDLTTPGAGLDLVVNDFNVQFQIGGTSDTLPRLYANIPRCHIEVPSHSIEDVISVETNFGAYTDDFSVANEMDITYFGA